MQTSLVVSSYNQPNALALCFEGVLTQTEPIDELVVADDGSEDDTRELVDAFTKRAPFPVQFVTQADRGFRKSRALNQALRASAGTWVAFLDGDCIPPPGWLGRFREALESGWDFAVAGYVLLSLQRTQALDLAEIRAGRIASRCTAEEQRAFDRIQRRESLYRLLGKRKKPKIRGGNWAATRTCLEAVNGFDERFEGFGKEDSDIRNRLRNAGFRGRSLWDTNWVFHCAHDLDPRRTRPEVVRGAPDLTYYRSRKRATWCEKGLVPPGPGTPDA